MAFGSFIIHLLLLPMGLSKLLDYEKKCIISLDAGGDINRTSGNRLQFLRGWREGHE